MKRRMIDFFCLECGEEFEELMFYNKKGKADTKVVCPKCSSEDMEEIQDIRTRIHKDGNHYSHVTWSLHHAGD